MKNKLEIWLPVVGYEGLYEVSNKGRVKSLAREIHYFCFNKFQIRKSVNKVMSFAKDKDGYLVLNLALNGKNKHFTI